MWSTSLTAHQKTFQNLAGRVSAWDRQLVDNSTKISALYQRCFQAERDCSEVERQLAGVEMVQGEIEVFLDRYEGEVDAMLEKAGVGEGVDAERERTYKVAEGCAKRLGELKGSLGEMVGEINVVGEKLSGNNANGGSDGKEDPLRQIVGVLNRHLGQLQVIGQGSAELQSKVLAAQREARALGGERGIGGGGQWVDDFGRSYLGRR